ncbi:sortase [Peptococcus simiae]|uniref:Sortase n=1 Tax=Peptococcus simiae TaxID=1643805 RepID=A0ABW9H1D0_9FIRM
MKAPRTYLVLALVCLAAALVLTGYNLYDARRAGLEAARHLAALQAVSGQALNRRAAGGQAGLDPGQAHEGMPTVQVDGRPYIGEIIIEAYGLHLPVMADLSSENLRMAPCLYRGALPDNHPVIAGHNYTSHFGPLLTLSTGSRVLFTDTLGRTYTYRVAKRETLADTALADLLDSRPTDLTLVTCTLSGYTRCVLRCELVDGGR